MPKLCSYSLSCARHVELLLVCGRHLLTTQPQRLYICSSLLLGMFHRGSLEDASILSTFPMVSYVTYASHMLFGVSVHLRKGKRNSISLT